MKIQIPGLSLPGKTPQALETSKLDLDCDGLLAKSNTDSTMSSYAAALYGTRIKSNTR